MKQSIKNLIDFLEKEEIIDYSYPAKLPNADLQTKRRFVARVNGKAYPLYVKGPPYLAIADDVMQLVGFSWTQHDLYLERPGAQSDLKLRITSVLEVDVLRSRMMFYTVDKKNPLKI